jgi:hypothetical protein
MFGLARSILARSTCRAVGELAVFIWRRRARFSSGVRDRYGAGAARRREVAAAGAHLLGALLVDVGMAGDDERLGGAVHEVEIVAREVEVARLRLAERGLGRMPVEAEPVDGVDDRVDVLLLFLLRVGVVEAQVADAAVLLGEAEVEADALRVADVQVAVRLGRKAGADARRIERRRRVVRRVAGRSGEAPAGVGALGEVALDDVAQEVAGGCGGFPGVAHVEFESRPILGCVPRPPVAAPAEPLVHRAAKLYLRQRAEVNGRPPSCRSMGMHASACAVPDPAMKRLFLLVPAAAALFAATAAQAGGVSWSVGVNVPPVATVVTSGPAWAPAPVRVVPGAVVYSTPAYAPAPIVYDEPYVTPYPYVVPRVGYWGPPVVVAPRYRYWGPHRGHWAPVPRGGWDRHDHWRH